MNGDMLQDFATGGHIVRISWPVVVSAKIPSASVDLLTRTCELVEVMWEHLGKLGVD